MKPCACGAMVEDHVTTHWTGRETRHRVDGSELEGADKRASVSVAVSVAAPDPRSEKEVQHDIVLALRRAGFHVWDTSQPRAAMVTPGLPDLIVAGRGRAAFVEVKAAKGRLTEAQRLFREVVTGAGWEHHIWRSEADAIRWMEARLEEVMG